MYSRRPEGKSQTTHAADDIPAIPLEIYARDHRERSSLPDNRRLGDGTSVFFPPTFVLARRNVLYLPSKIREHRESADECASSRNYARTADRLSLMEPVLRGKLLTRTASRLPEP